MNIGIVGLGLIGGSLGKAIIKNTTHKVFGMDKDIKVIYKAELLNAIHEQIEDISNLDVVIIATNPSIFENIAESYLKNMKDGATLMDIGGNKKGAVSKMEVLAKKYPNINFIATHPMAGREFSGIEHSQATLFDKASLLFIPVSVDLKTNAKIRELFKQIGFTSIVDTTYNEHDRIIAYTSQLAHIVSSSYVKSPTAKEHNGFSAGSFKDMTRVAKLSPAMWSELLMENKDNVLFEVDTLLQNLILYKEALEQNDTLLLEKLLQEGNIQKENIEKATRAWKKNQ